MQELYFVDGIPLPLSELQREPVKVTCNFDLPEGFPGADKYRSALIRMTKPIVRTYGWSVAEITYVLMCSSFFDSFSISFSITLQLLFPGRFNGFSGTNLN